MSANLEMEESLLFGGKLSGAYPVYKDLAQLSSYGFPWWLLNRISQEEWKQKSSLDKVKEILYVSGQIEFINATDVLTKLAASLGDSRRRVSMAGLKDELAARTSQSSNP